ALVLVVVPDLVRTRALVWVEVLVRVAALAQVWALALVAEPVLVLVVRQGWAAVLARAWVARPGSGVAPAWVSVVKPAEAVGTELVLAARRDWVAKLESAAAQALPGRDSVVAPGQPAAPDSVVTLALVVVVVVGQSLVVGW